MPRKLTPRQLAGRMNRKKRKGLTPEGREALRQAALTNRPWEHSTGPRTAAGKAASCRNALQLGDRADELLPEEFKAYVALVEQAEAIAPRGLVVRSEVTARLHREALKATFTAGGLLKMAGLLQRQVAAERLARFRQLSAEIILESLMLIGFPPFPAILSRPAMSPADPRRQPA